MDSNRTARHFGSLRQWHWISSALSLIGLLFFAVTGITLNHAGQIPAQTVTTTVETTLPEDLNRQLLERRNRLALPAGAPLPGALREWLARETGLTIPSREAEWDDFEIYLSLPRPGGDAWVSIDPESGSVLHERSQRGWIAYANDLHKGRDTGAAWRWFIDLFAVACLVFGITGLLLLWQLRQRRPMTWPMTALGLVAPVLLILLFIH